MTTATTISRLANRVRELTEPEPRELTEPEAWRVIGHLWEETTDEATCAGLCWSVEVLTSRPFWGGELRARYGQISYELEERMKRRIRQAMHGIHPSDPDAHYIFPLGQQRGARAMIAYWFALEAEQEIADAQCVLQALDEREADEEAEERAEVYGGF